LQTSNRPYVVKLHNQKSAQRTVIFQRCKVHSLLALWVLLKSRQLEMIFYEKHFKLITHYLPEKFEDTNMVIRGKQTTHRPNDKGQTMIYKTCQNTTQKTDDWATPIHTGNEIGYRGRVSSSCVTSGTRRVTIITNLVISHLWHKYSGTVNQVMVVTVKISNWRHQRNH
jgi:hypothetical protein